ncbi:MAG: hypothetical protein GX951_03445 [Mollicutes bacterium]|nr:hypothetical protein [Mollicutes bacterium]
MGLELSESILLGYVRLINGSYHSYNETHEQFLEALKKDYGLVLIRKEKVEPIVYLGDVYSITKLPWSEEKLPIMKWKRWQDYTSYEDGLKEYNSLRKNR